MNLNPLSDELSRALVQAERRKNSIYLAEQTSRDTLPSLVARGKIIDKDGYVADWEKNPRFRTMDVMQFRHYRTVFIREKGVRMITTREMLAEHGLERAYGQATLVELLKVFVLHHKVMLDFMKSGKSLAAIGYDMFSTTCWKYPELALDESGKVTLSRREPEPGMWSADHILLMRANLAT